MTPPKPSYAPFVITALVLAAVGLGASVGGKMNRIPSFPVPGGDPARGARLIVDFGCGACHTIPGIRAANGVVGPPLYFFSRRTMIAGEVPNTLPNLMQWIEDPQSIEPTVAMPRLGLNAQQARDVAAYLYTLK